MTIKKTIRIPKSDLPSKNNIVKAELVDLGGKDSLIARYTYLSQEAGAGTDFVDSSATVSGANGPDSLGKYYATVSNLVSTTGFQLGASISATNGTGSIPSGSKIYKIINSTSIKIETFGTQATNGTVTNIETQGVLISVVVTKNPHTFKKGDVVWIKNAGKYYDGTVQVFKVVNNEVHYYNESILTTGRPVSIEKTVLLTSAYIKRKMPNISQSEKNVHNVNSINSLISNIVIAGRKITVTTLYPHGLEVNDSFSIDTLYDNALLYLKRSNYYSVTTDPDPQYEKIYKGDAFPNQIYVIESVPSLTSFTFTVLETNPNLSNLQTISTSGTVGSISGPTDGFYTATITGMTNTVMAEVPFYSNGYYSGITTPLIATNGTGSLGTGLISTQGTVSAVSNGLRTISGMTSTKGLKAGSLIAATSSTGSIITGVAVESVVNSTSIKIYDYGNSFSQTTNKAGAIKNIVCIDNATFAAEILSPSSIKVVSTAPLSAGTVTNILVRSVVSMEPDNMFQSVVRYTTTNPHQLTIGSDVSIYGIIPGVYNVANYKLFYKPTSKTFDISYIPKNVLNRLSPIFSKLHLTFPPFGAVPYSANLEDKPYKSGGFINNFLYYLRYRLVSADKNKFSAWTPIIKADHHYYDELDDERLDGGDQSW